MYSDGVFIFGLVTVVFLWLGILTVLLAINKSSNGKSKQSFFLSKKILDSVFEGEEKGVKLDQLIRKITGLGNQVEDIKEQLNSLVGESENHIQRVELLRYNPYDDTGGDQSFSVAILDNKGTGFVVTSLHARSGTRVFAKPI